MSRLRILIADDHDLLREELKNFVEQRPEWELVGEAANGREAVQKALQLQPELAILDISMPEMDGLEAASEIRCALPKTELIVLTACDSAEIKIEALRIGIRSYVLKARLDHDLPLAIEAAANHHNGIGATALP